jgi:hypothetical protein
MIGEAVALHADALPDNIAEMDADAEFDGSLGRQAGVAHDHGVLDLDCAPHLVDHTAKFDEEPVAGALDHVPVMRGGRTLGSINPWKRRGRHARKCQYRRGQRFESPPLHQEVGANRAGFPTRPYRSLRLTRYSVRLSWPWPSNPSRQNQLGQIEVDFLAHPLLAVATSVAERHN